MPDIAQSRAEWPTTIETNGISADQFSFGVNEELCMAACSCSDRRKNREVRIQVDRTFNVLGWNEYDRLKQWRTNVCNVCLKHIDRYKAPAAVLHFKAVQRTAKNDHGC